MFPNPLSPFRARDLQFPSQQSALDQWIEGVTGFSLSLNLSTHAG